MRQVKERGEVPLLGGRTMCTQQLCFYGRAAGKLVSTWLLEDLFLLLATQTQGRVGSWHSEPALPAKMGILHAMGQ